MNTDQFFLPTSPSKPNPQGLSRSSSTYKLVPSGRWKQAAKLVTKVNALTTALKEGADKAKENRVAQVNPAPQCLSKVLGQLRAQERSFASDSAGKRRYEFNHNTYPCIFCSVFFIFLLLWYFISSFAQNFEQKVCKLIVCK